MRNLQNKNRDSTTPKSAKLLTKQSATGRDFTFKSHKLVKNQNKPKPTVKSTDKVKCIGKDLDCATKNFIELCKASKKKAINRFPVKELSELVEVQSKLCKYIMLLNTPPYSKEAKSKAVIICKICKSV